MHARIAGCLGWVATVLLAGCASAPPAAPEPPPSAMTTEVLSKLAAHHAHDLDAALGKPQDARQTKDGTNFVWAVTETVSTYVPNSAAATSGFIGKPAPDSSDQATGGNVEHDVVCRVRVGADASGAIRSIDFNGPHKVCDNAGRQLAAWIKSVG